jgi:hypothetical protein
MPIVKMQQMKSGVSFLTIPKKFVRSMVLKKGMPCRQAAEKGDVDE